LLTKFIDLFNYYPIQVDKLRNTNDSHEFTYIMNSGTHGTRNEYGDKIVIPSEKKTDEQKEMIKLLSLVSNKINERFVNLKACFRYLDTNHS